MAGGSNPNSAQNSWLVILNNSLVDSELHRLLKMQQLRIKGISGLLADLK